MNYFLTLLITLFIHKGLSAENGINCPEPESPQNGPVAFSSLKFGAELKYECETGFVLNIRETRFCLNGTWSGEEPQCVEPCKVVHVKNGEIRAYSRNRYRRILYNKLPIGELLENGRKLTLRCNRNFQVVGKGTSEIQVKCINGQWSQELSCQPVSCRSAPPPVPNAQIWSVNAHHGGNVFYQCEKHFKKVKIGDVRCRFGQWSGPPPVCKDTRCYTETLYLPGVIKDPVVQYYTSGRGFTPVCMEGYEYAIDIEEIREIVCGDGEWIVDANPCKAASCTDPPPIIKNGFPTEFNIEHDSLVRYECEPLYRLEEAGTVRCTFGNWSGSSPKCKDTRCYPKVLDLPGVTKDPEVRYYTSGRGFRPACMDGYEYAIQEIREIVCEDGEWIVDANPCKAASCTDPPPNINNGFAAEFNIEHGSLVRYECEPLHLLHEAGAVRCTFGNWSGFSPKCKDTRCYIELLDLPGVAKDPEVRYYSSGSGFRPVCMVGYEYAVHEIREIVCEDGEWIVDAKPCKAASCTDPPPIIKNGFATEINFEHGSLVRYECEPLYLFQEAGAVRCSFGNWSGFFPKCKDTRCYTELLDLPGVAKDPVDQYYTSGRGFRPVCMDGYEYAIEEIREIVCEDGEWIVDANPCKAASCTDPPPTIKNGFNTKCNFEHGSFVRSYECEPLSHLEEAGTIRCTFGNWNGSSPKCKVESCEIPKINQGMMTTRTISQQWSWERLGYKTITTYTPEKVGSVYNNRAEYFVTCNAGFYFQAILITTHVLSWCDRGQWTPDPACLRPTAKPMAKNEKVEDKVSEPEPTTTPPTTMSTEEATKEPTTVSNNNCTCTYNLLDANIQAYADDELLSFGSKVRDGVWVKFYCTRYKYARLLGRSEVMCSDCRGWHSSEFPMCIDPVEGDVIILWQQKEETLRLAPNGELSAIPESNLTILCAVVNNTNYAVWSVPHKANVTVGYGTFHLSGRYLIMSTINITRADSTHEGFYQCSGGPRNPRGIYLTVPRKQVTVPGVVGCGPIEKSDQSQLIADPSKEFYRFGKAFMSIILQP